MYVRYVYVYVYILNELKTPIEQKRLEIANRKGVVLHQDNARPHVSLITRQKLELSCSIPSTIFIRSRAL